MTTLNKLSYFATGGTCDNLYTPCSHRELQEIIKKIFRQGDRYFILGAGTNSLVSDDHWPGAVVSCHNLDKISKISESEIVCQAGVNNRAIVAYCLQHELSGAEWMTELPGQIGATTRMNARCYGGEISQLVNSVKVVTAAGASRSYHTVKDKIFRGYKDTVFMNNGDFISEVHLSLQKGDRDKMIAKMQRIADDRTTKGQFLYPSCGCVFKNNYQIGIPSGVLLDQADVRRFSGQKVFVSPNHANFIFNDGGSSREISELTVKMRQAVYEKFGVWLVYELEFLGKFPVEVQQAVNQQRQQQPKQQLLDKIRVSLTTKLPLTKTDKY